MKKKWLRLFYLLVSFALIFSGGQTALAQDDDVTLQEIIVTGSRIERTDVTSVSPISVFTEVDFEASGEVTLEDFVQNMPSVTGGFNGKTVNNGSRGAAYVALRGLGSGRTLVLPNGKRLPAVSTGASVDLNMIPAALIERVEVLRDGASTVYGSDAIAGVVNLITKTDFDGAEFSFQYDKTGEDDGRIKNFSGVIGASSDRGNVVFGVDYNDREKIMQGDRPFSACPLFENADGSTYCGGSGTSYPGHFYSATYPSHILDANDNIVAFTTADHGFNYARYSYMVTPQEVLSTYANARYDLIQERDRKSVV